METTVTIDLAPLASELGFPQEQLRRTVELLDEGNTVPFITRYRKDQTGGLDEEQIRQIQDSVTRQRMLAERKRTILKSIESQGKLTDDLAEKIRTATSTKRLEDLYLPYKPKKQTLATIARDRGLEPLAREIIKAEKIAEDLDRRALDFVDIDKGLRSQADVLLGVGHLIAEQFSERADLREVLRNIVRRTGKTVCSRLPSSEEGQAKEASGEGENASAASAEETAGHDDESDATGMGESPGDAEDTTAETESAEVVDYDSEADQDTEESHELAEISEIPLAPASDAPTSDAQAFVPADPAVVAAAAEDPALAQQAADAGAAASSEPAATDAAIPPGVPPAAQLDPAERQRQARLERKKRKEEERKRKKKKQESAFKDYFKFEESIGKLPPHRILAINRGERARVLRVKLEADFDAMRQEAEEKAVPADHPHREFLRGCLKDALARLIIPALEREIRRELTDKAEEHAIAVFARNLRKLLLTPPISGHRVLAIDPGFRSGCKLAALDEFGNLHGHGAIYLVGGGERLKRSRARLIEMIQMHKITVVAIGNGTACRETEHLVADVLANELKGADISYVIVNEAGASVYSTSPVGREELGQYEASQRSAVSIGRRLLDPLSELVKINAANIGVGLYQHDMKSKHLQDSLDAVVQSCVNYVGVELNTASPSLLSYVSGLNQLTARRLFEYRQQHGPFANRQQLKDVPGIGEATFIQAAGFLKIPSGDNPLDATWIHPESYGAAQQVLDRLGCGVEELAREVSTTRGNAATHNRPTDNFAAGLSAPAPETSTTAPDQPISPDTAEAETPEATAAPSESPAESAPAPTTVTAGDPDPVAPVSEPAELQAVELSAAIEPVVIEPVAVVADQPVVEAAPAAEADFTATNPQSAIRNPQSPDADKPPSLIAQRAGAVNSRELATELRIGELLCRDILTALTRPGRDPREDLPPPLFRREVLKLEDLKAGMELAGTVLNVVDFGAFVDIGLHDTGLVHISRLADRFIKDPHEVVGVGDTLRVWVQSVDKERRRVSLTAIAPGTKRQERQRREQRPPRDQKDQPRRPPPKKDQRPQQGGQQQPSQRPPRQQSDRSQHRRPDKRDNRRDARPTQQGRPFELQSKKVVPKKLTKAMKEGRAPLRTFGDLKQFLNQQEPPPEQQPPPENQQ